MRNKKKKNVKKANKRNVASPVPANVASGNDGTWKCKQDAQPTARSQRARKPMMSDATEKQKETGIATRKFLFLGPPGRMYHAQDMGALFSSL